MDHLCRSSRSWTKLLDALQKCPGPITKMWLLTQSEAGYNSWELSEMLEAFLVDQLSDTFFPYASSFQVESVIIGSRCGGGCTTSPRAAATR